MEYPQITCLYKYYPYNIYSLSMLINKKIWLAKPESFNDPFDCCPDSFKINPEYLVKKGIPQENHEEYQQRFNKRTKDDMNKLGVFCMSELNDNILMWSHYADKHKGFCVEFLRTSGNLLGKYEYTKNVTPEDKYPVIISDPNGRMPTSASKVLFIKARDWTYEKEWRIIYDEGNTLEPLPADISSIIFGLKMVEEHKNTIKSILLNQPNIKYKQAIKDENQLKLKIIDL